MTGRSTARIRFRAGVGGEPVLADLEASAEYTFVPARWGATIVGSADHPVAGDHLGLKVDVGVGCCAEMRAAGVTVARRSSRGRVWPDPAGSSLTVSVSVARDAMLAWHPEPAVAADGCDHRVDATVSLAANARLLWTDELLIDRRQGSAPGTWTSRLRVVREGWPIVCSEIGLGPAAALWESPAVLEGARAVSLAVVVDPDEPATRWRPARATHGSATGIALPLAGPGMQMLGWGDDLFDCRQALEQVAERAGAPVWALSRWRSTPMLDAVGS